MITAMRAKSAHISIDLKDLDDAIRIEVKDNGLGMDSAKLEQARSLLSAGRRDELELYYGELAGESHRGSGLRMVSMMIDKAEVHSTPGQGTQVVVYRNKR